jgi:hypothetical protein
LKSGKGSTTKCVGFGEKIRKVDKKDKEATSTDRIAVEVLGVGFDLALANESSHQVVVAYTLHLYTMVKCHKSMAPHALGAKINTN